MLGNHPITPFSVNPRVSVHVGKPSLLIGRNVLVAGKGGKAVAECSQFGEESGVDLGNKALIAAARFCLVSADVWKSTCHKLSSSLEGKGR